MELLYSKQTKLGNYIDSIGEPAEENILIVGVVHGDEPQGKYLIERYLEKRYGFNFPLSRKGRGQGRGVALKIPRRGKRGILFIPCLNPDGMQNNTRTNSNNVDINRNFPTQNWGKNEGDNATCDDETTNYFGGKSAGNEIETRFLIETIENYSPSLVMTLHAPYKIVNYDGPAQKEAEAISKIINYPVEASIGYPTPGSFGTWAGVERNIPTITLELDEEIPVQQLVKPAFEIFDYLKS